MFAAVVETKKMAIKCDNSPRDIMAIHTKTFTNESRMHEQLKART